MNELIESSWKQETLWVVRNERGAIIRVSETHPSEWAKEREAKKKDPPHLDRPAGE